MSDSGVPIYPRFFANGRSNPMGAEGNFCAPFPACDPAGCGIGGGAPIECESCDSALVGLYLAFLVLAAVLIVTVNLLVIVVIARTEDLRRRYGYVKASLAVSDLLMGLFVLPAAIGNVAWSLFAKRREQLESGEGGVEWSNALLRQENTLASSFFGTIAIVSVTTSVYNLLLLSLDRWMAIRNPIRSASGKFFSKTKLKIGIACVWILGILLSSVPAMKPDTYAYAMDPTTFLYVQSRRANDNSTISASQNRASPYFTLGVLGIPYLATITLNLMTWFVSVRSLNGGDDVSYTSGHSKTSKRERKKRMKAVMNSYPEMDYNDGAAQPWYRRIPQSLRNSSNRLSRAFNFPKDHKIEGTSAYDSRSKRTIKLGRRIMKMVLMMVFVFTVCVLPYIVVVTMGSKKSLDCDTFGVPYLVATCLLISNSGCNFFIYNAWQRSFRQELAKIIPCMDERSEGDRHSYIVNPPGGSSELRVTDGSGGSRGRSASLQATSTLSVGRTTRSTSLAPTSSCYHQTST